MSTAIKFRACAHHLQPCIQLVQNRDLLVHRKRRIQEYLAQSRAFVPGSAKIAELTLNSGRIEMRLGDHVGQGAGIAGSEGRPSVPLPFQILAKGANQHTVVVEAETNCLPRAVDGQLGCKLLQFALRCCAGGLNLLLRGGHNALALGFERFLNALFVVDAVPLRLLADGLDLDAQLRQPLFDHRQAFVGLGGRQTRVQQLLLEIFIALAERLGNEAED